MKLSLITTFALNMASTRDILNNNLHKSSTRRLGCSHELTNNDKISLFLISSIVF